MKFMKRAQIYKGTNVTFNPKTLNAHSYDWWRFVAVVDGLIIFNDYRYSVTTAKHQRKVSSLMSELGIKADITMPLPRGIRHDQTLLEMIIEAEEEECDRLLQSFCKQDERNAKARQRRLEAKLTDYLENSVSFRDYTIKPRSEFGVYNTVAIHQCVDSETLESDVQNALHSFHRDGFGSIVFYIGGV